MTGLHASLQCLARSLENRQVFTAQEFSVCIKKTADDPDETLFGRTLNILSHGNYSFYEPAEMLPETKESFEKVLDDFLDFYPSIANYSPASQRNQEHDERPRQNTIGQNPLGIADDLRAR